MTDGRGTSAGRTGLWKGHRHDGREREGRQLGGQACGRDIAMTDGRGRDVNWADRPVEGTSP